MQPVLQERRAGAEGAWRDSHWKCWRHPRDLDKAASCKCGTWIPIPAALSESEEGRDTKLEESGQSQRATLGSRGLRSQTCGRESKICHQKTSLSLDSLVSLSGLGFLVSKVGTLQGWQRIPVR